MNLKPKDQEISAAEDMLDDCCGFILITFDSDGYTETLMSNLLIEQATHSLETAKLTVMMREQEIHGYVDPSKEAIVRPKDMDEDLQ